MLNAVWIAMVVGALLCAAYTGRVSEVALASTDSAKAAVELVIGLLGVMAFWLGLMRVLQRGGLLRALARLLRPVTARLFPDVPPEHPAMSMMILNIVANLLGLGNAATPFGLKAMVELDRLNRDKGTATDAMALFLAINTSSLALLPTGMIALRASAGSEAPGSILVPTLLATTLSTAVAIVLAKSLQRLPVFRLPAPPAGPAPEAAAPAPPADDGIDLSDAEAELDAEREPASLPVRVLGWLLVAASLAAVGYALYGEAHAPVEVGAPAGWAGALNSAITEWPLVLLIVGFVLYGMLRGVKVYDAVVDGGREAFQITLRFAPFLIVILVAIGMFRASGAIDLLVRGLDPLTSLVGMPAETLPMALLRPLSGSGAYGVAAEIMKQHGADSLVGQIASTMQGSTETTFYVLALYFGVARIRNTRHTVPTCLTADLAGVLGSVWACRLILG